MYDTEPLDSPHGRPESFHAELAKIRSDPAIRGLALRRAGKHDLAKTPSRRLTTRSPG